ncbi:MAG: hypothetical protein PHE24_00540 [Patescibacteria group bacterium]|nr:hypothetical protein [Patescibacteria group bacterium]
MKEKFICGTKKYLLEWGNITLPVLLKELPREIEVEGYRLALKSSFHVSLVCPGKIIEKNNISIKNFADLVIKDFCEFTKDHDVSLTGYRDEFRFVAQNERRTVVMMVKVSNLDSFFDLLNRKYDLKLEVPPTHITLYTLQSDIGIYLTDQKDLKQFTKIIKSPIKLPDLGEV